MSDGNPSDESQDDMTADLLRSLVPAPTESHQQPNPIPTILCGTWARAQRDLDNPNVCRLADLRCTTGPAWPAEYALRTLQAELYSILALDELARPLHPQGAPVTGVGELLSFHVRLRAAMLRLPGWPQPVAPNDWPTTLDGPPFLGRSGRSALDVAIRVLEEIDTAITRWSGHVLTYGDHGQPMAAEGIEGLSDPRLCKWYDNSIMALRQLLASGVDTIDAFEHQVSAVLPRLEAEYRRSTAPPLPVPPTPRKQNKKMTRAEAAAAIGLYLSRRPKDSAQEVADEIGCSKGMVVESVEWKANQRRLKAAAPKSKRPLALPLVDHLTTAGDVKDSQLRDSAERQAEIDDELDQKEERLLARIGLHFKEHPAHTDRQVIDALGCSFGDIERWRARVQNLTEQQTSDRRVRKQL
jgi:hypothetical protein